MQLIAGFYVVRSESRISQEAFDLLFSPHKDLISLRSLKQDRDFGDWWYYLYVSPSMERDVFAWYAFALGQMIERHGIEAKKAKQKE